MSAKKPVGKFQRKHDFGLGGFSRDIMFKNSFPHGRVLLVTLHCIAMRSEREIEIPFLKYTMHNIKTTKFGRHSYIFSRSCKKDGTKHQVIEVLVQFSFINESHQ